MTCEVEPEFILRWRDIYMAKYRAEGELAARKWFMNFVSDECKPHVMAAIKQGGKT